MFKIFCLPFWYLFLTLLGFELLIQEVNFSLIVWPPAVAFSTFPTFILCLSFLICNTGQGLPWWFSGKEPICQCRRHEFITWVWKMPWRRKWHPTLVFLSGKSHVRRSLWATVHGVPRESGTAEQISNTGQQALEQAWHLGSAPERGAKGSGPSGAGMCPTLQVRKLRP